MPFDLNRLPRVSLGTLPTPLHDAVRLRRALGGESNCPRILIKRDDLTGLAFGGNKVRKLEFLVADALTKSATHVITAGAAQSNHARATAAAALLHGMKPILVLDTDDPDQMPQGNLLLDRLLDAEIRFVPKGTDSDGAMADVANEIRSEGGRPYVIPIGGSTSIGATGYLTMTIELKAQLAAIGANPTRLYFANGSRGTQAGIVLGAKLLGMTYDIFGILISQNDRNKEARAIEIGNGASELIGSDVRLTEIDLISVDGYFGEAYAVPTKAADDAIRLVARTEAIFLDPVYTGKAMSALIDHVQTGVIGPTETVVFVHTGGGPSLFVHGERLVSGM